MRMHMDEATPIVVVGMVCATFIIVVLLVIGREERIAKMIAQTQATTQPENSK